MIAQHKVIKTEELKKLAQGLKAVYFADLSRIKATEISGLRQKFSSMGIKIKVVKNRLTKRALTESGIAGIEGFLTGPTALILSYDDPLVPAKVIKDFTKKNAELKIKGAYLDRSVYAANQFDYLASLPSKPELLSELVGCLSQQVAELVFVLEAVMRQFIAGLEEIQSASGGKEVTKGEEKP
jgi:large subunit ribosomal protein L10